MKRAINLSLIGAFLFSVALAASPQLHDRIHGHAEHECAVTLIASGNYEHSPAPVMVVRPMAVAEYEIVNSEPAFVASLFLSASILEHAPPVSA